ncbi:MAG: hypothetical protein H3C57_05270 [Gammaproteobacteria bacterium]|nr:hypothetical protein [Gammaproteobacteria bacterium]
MKILKASFAGGFLAALGLLAASGAQALTLSYSATWNGGSYVVAGSGADTVSVVPGSDFFGNAFATPTTDFPAVAGFGFQDSYIFTIPVGATANAVVSSISLGVLEVSNLQLRLFALPAEFDPVLSIGAGCPGGCLADWSTTVDSANVSYTVLDSLLLGAGSYVLEIRGDATGISGGSYSGVLNLAEVPVPGVAWLFGLAVAGLGWMRRCVPVV